MQCVLYRTEEPVLGYVVVNAVQLTARLEFSPVGVKVIMRHSLLDAHTESQMLLGEGVNSIHKLSIVRGESVRGRHSFKQWPRRIET